MKKLLAILLVLLALPLIGGCATYMAAKQPKEKNLELLQKGTSRREIIAEFGAPLLTEERGGVLTDIFSFIHGYSGVERTGRALGHAVATFYTLGLWQLAAIPIEGEYRGREIKIEVNYDGQAAVEKIIIISGGEVICSNPEAVEEAAARGVFCPEE